MRRERLIEDDDTDANGIHDDGFRPAKVVTCPHCGTRRKIHETRTVWVCWKCDGKGKVIYEAVERQGQREQAQLAKADRVRIDRPKQPDDEAVGDSARMVPRGTRQRLRLTDEDADSDPQRPARVGGGVQDRQGKRLSPFLPTGFRRGRGDDA
jgi:adenine-specific DNA methylase